MKIKFKEILKKAGLFFEHLIFPDDIKCIFCGKDVADFENKSYCDECEKDVEINNGNRCIICDDPIANEAIVCDYCQKHKREFKKAFCPFVYNGAIRHAILAYKESNKRFLAKTFAKYIANLIIESKVKIDYVTFVPLTKKKLRQRSFNQSKLLATEVAKILNVEVVELFERVKDIPAQKFSSFDERHKNMIDLYKLLPTKLEADKNYLIVDDVITTGATMNYCSGLISKKVENVYVCALARNKKRIQKDDSSRVTKTEYFV